MGYFKKEGHGMVVMVMEQERVKGEARYMFKGRQGNVSYKYNRKNYYKTGYIQRERQRERQERIKGGDR